MQKQAELVLRNGAVYTVDPRRSLATAVAVSGREIIFVGSDAGISACIGPNTEVIDLGGKMVLPGFVDSHAHASSAFDENKTLSLHGLKSLADYQAALRKFAASRPELEVIYGSGWDNSVFPPSGPGKEDLDAVVSDRPVSLHSNDGHSIWVNSRTMEIARVTRDTPDPTGGVIEKDPATKEPSGTFRENANDLIQNMLPPYTVAQIKDSIRIFAAEAARVGITTVHDPLLLFPDSEGMLLGFGAARNNMVAYEQLAGNRELTLRVRGSLLADPAKGVSQVLQLAAACAGHTHPLFQVAGAKVFVDGVVEGGTAYLLSPYAHRPGFRGAPLWRQQGLNALFEALDRDKLQIHIHAIGDAAVHMALDALAYARRRNGQRDSRHLMTHLHIMDYGDISRFAALGVVGVPQPFWHVKGEYFRELEVKYLGRERAEKEYPMKSFMNAGVTLAAASDYPVQVPSRPLEGIQLGVTRCLPGETDPNEILGPDERMTLADMITAFTINGAYANFLENETGSIQAGKKADLVVLEKNLFELPVSEIAGTRVLMTLFEGRTVFRDAGF
jgi:predicted amidohydrolase YtcJ